MQHEGIRVATKFCDYERHALCHQASHERDIAGEAIQLRDQDAALGGLSCVQGSGELRAAVQRVRALAGLAGAT